MSDKEWDDSELRQNYETMRDELAEAAVDNGQPTAHLVCLGPTVNISAAGGFVSLTVNETMARRIHEYLGKWLERDKGTPVPPIPGFDKVH